VNLHEYQARDILRRYGIPVPPGEVATTADEARAIAARLGGGGAVVVKAQVHVGGRGKAGGVKLARDPAEAAAHAARILGMSIKGLVVQRVLVAPAAEISAESYVGMIVDRASQRPVLMVSAAGGVDIEEVAAQSPEKIHRLALDPRYGVLPHQALGLALKLYRDVTQARAAADIMQRLYAAFYAVGASLAEINPLATTRDGALAALDAKIVIDDNELQRHPELAALRDTSAEAPSEVAAREAGLTFIKLEGTTAASRRTSSTSAAAPTRRRWSARCGSSRRTRASAPFSSISSAASPVATTWRTASCRPRRSSRSRCRS